MTRVKAMVRTRIPEQCYQNNLKRFLSNCNVQLKIKSFHEFQISQSYFLSFEVRNINKNRREMRLLSLSNLAICTILWF